MDGSTTIFHVAELLAKRSGLRVVTCNLDTYLRLQRYPGIEAILTGGTQDQQTDNFTGPMARLVLRHLSFDVGFFSSFAYGDQGPAEPSLDDAELKELVAERSKQIGIAINHQKLTQQASGVWHCEPGRVVLATDLPPTHPDVQPFASLVSAIR